MDDPFESSVALAELLSMGFDVPQAEEALEVCDGNVERATDLLLSGGVASAVSVDNSTKDVTSASSSNVTNVVSCDMSQYSVDNGRSACTCIALTAVTKFLQQTSTTTTTNANQIVTPDFLCDMVRKGVEMYQKISSEDDSSSSNVEHMSAEEVLNQKVPELSSLAMVEGGVRQGLLTKNDPNHPLGLRVLLEGCQSQGDDSSWMAVLLTKTPETVVVCLPPDKKQSSNDKEEWPSFLLLDSHPRYPFSPNGAYGRFHGSLEELVQSLETIFPPTELGPDVPEMMVMMYNSFDLYPLVLREQQASAADVESSTSS